MTRKKKIVVRRGRPPNAERPNTILEAAFHEFAENGFLATRLEDVAARAGVAKGTVYLYYKNKEALFEAAVRSRIVPVVKELGHLTETFDGTTVELMHRVIRTIYDRIADANVRTLLRILIAEGQRFPNLIAFYHKEVIANVIALLEIIVTRGVQRGEFRPSALTQLPIVLIAPAIMAAIWQMTFARERPLPLSKFLIAHLDLITRALQADEIDAKKSIGTL